MTEKQWVAGTIMTMDENGKSVFLVSNKSGEANNFTFPAAKIVEDRTGLASILEDLKHKLTIDVSSLNLFELTNAVVEETRIPLFVFELTESLTDLESLLKLPNHDILSWQRTEEIRGALATWEISGVPQF
ncbi:hypothetical protein ACWOFR_16085 [Carnobacterium gallinarum]|uniref:hypothetical protein n=1 Tax=Carnobacterium gallinarum TaxID=2749 RepID=UPI00054EAB29|nr:hypothetical protein [Carnobacterium gallinarum]